MDIMAKVSYYLTNEQVGILQLIAEYYDSDMSKQIRRAVNEYIENNMHIAIKQEQLKSEMAAKKAEFFKSLEEAKQGR